MDSVDGALYRAFIGVSILLIVAPGPNILLIVSNSVQQGLRTGFATVAGTNLGLVAALLMAGAGLGALQGFAAGLFEIARWLGVGYLAWLGVARWRAANDAVVPETRPGSGFWQGFGVAIVNPTTTGFFVAFLPQFVDTARPAWPQFLVLGLTFLALAATLDGLYALLAHRLAEFLNSPSIRPWRERLGGALLIACALGLALVRAR